MEPSASPAVPMGGGSSSDVYTEQLYFSLLTHINTTERRVEALARLALRHLPQAPDTWSAIRKAFVLAAAPQSLTELDGPRNRALWCLVDALLKHSPHVFGPLASPRLLEYVAQQTPLQLMSSTSSSSAAALFAGGDSSDKGSGQRHGYRDAEHEAQRAAAWRWWESLLLSWEAFLPADVFASVRRYVTQRKSTAELDGALAHAAAASTATARAQNSQQEASIADRQQLRDDFDALRYLCANSTAAISSGSIGAAGTGGYSFEELLASFLSESGADTAKATASGEGAAKTPAAGQRSEDGTAAGPGAATKKPAAKKPRRQRDSDGSESESSSEEGDDDYVPQYVDGAKPRQMPDRGLPAQRKRREARRRPRDDDY